MACHEEVADLMAENRNLRDCIERLRNALEKSRPYVAELATFSNAAQCHRDLIAEIDAACGIVRAND